jgi:hypothetical protein
MRFATYGILTITLLSSSRSLSAQNLPARDDSRHSLLRAVWLGLVPAPSVVPAIQARKHCVQLPKDEEGDEIQGIHGDSLITSSCGVASFGPVDSTAQPRWMAAQYTWTSIYSAEDSSRGAGARDTVMEEEVLLFRTGGQGDLVPVWHERFETGDHAIWRSVTPEVAPARGGTLLSVMHCVNGTGGCSQEFLLRHPDGRWVPLWQAWLDQLPPGFEGRIRHGVRIDPRTLRGKAGFYGDRDPNCCPAQNLIVDLTVRGDSLALLRQAVRPVPGQ